MDGWTSPWHWIVLVILVAALFGYKKLPDAARSVGRSLRIFKTEMKGMVDDDAARDAAKSAPPAPPATENATVAAPVAATPAVPPAPAPPVETAAVEPEKTDAAQ